MKFNLKTLRKAVLVNKNPLEVIEQFEGFEAELREILSIEEKLGVTRLINLIQEILGE